MFSMRIDLAGIQSFRPARYVLFLHVNTEFGKMPGRILACRTNNFLPIPIDLKVRYVKTIPLHLLPATIVLRWADQSDMKASQIRSWILHRRSIRRTLYCERFI